MITMDFEQFIAAVSTRGHLDRDEAERVSQACLSTLARRLNRGEVRDLVDRLPIEMASWLFHDAEPEAFDVDEFLRRMASSAGIDPRAADRLARVVFGVLRDALDADEVAALEATLPDNMRPVFLNLALPSEDELVGDAAARMEGDASMETARRALEAVLETLAERIAPGEVQDLVSRLPLAFHEPLRRGAAQCTEHTRRRTAGEFVQVVAEREGVGPDTARRHIRAALAALRAALGDEEFSDMVVELPKDYDILIPAAV
ncbi:MAG: hypothetical protein QOJ19_741 [Acidimicrobiia bacterium]|jgi:uncharacterized protein (DUF2267 family)|nr:hypothetical protein [Acidimicrobiia bacterium]